MLTNYDRWVHLATRELRAKEVPRRYRCRIEPTRAQHSTCRRLCRDRPTAKPLRQRTVSGRVRLTKDDQRPRSPFAGPQVSLWIRKLRARLFESYFQLGHKSLPGGYVLNASLVIQKFYQTLAIPREPLRLLKIGQPASTKAACFRKRIL